MSPIHPLKENFKTALEFTSITEEEDIVQIHKSTHRRN